MVREYEIQTNLSNMSSGLPLASSYLSDCMTTKPYKSSPLIELFDEQIGICHTSVLPLQMSLTENQSQVFMNGASIFVVHLSPSWIAEDY